MSEESTVENKMVAIEIFRRFRESMTSKNMGIKRKMKISLLSFRLLSLSIEKTVEISVNITNTMKYL
jgi:hypothetical protein